MSYVIKRVGGTHEGTLNKKQGDIPERGSPLVFFLFWLNLFQILIPINDKFLKQNTIRAK